MNVTRGLLGDYLGEEVLVRLPPAQRDLLLRASLLDRFNASLLGALAMEFEGEPLGRDDLERLRALELFREIPGLSETWFAYHPLFREILRRELERTSEAAAITALRRTIAQWFATEGQTREAVQHLVALDDIPAATALIESRLSDAFAREDWQSVASWLRCIPMEAMRESPELLLASAWVAFLSGRDARISEILESMRDRRIRNLATAAQRAEIAILVRRSRSRPAHVDQGRGRRDRRHPAKQTISLRLRTSDAWHGIGLGGTGRGGASPAGGVHRTRIGTDRRRIDPRLLRARPRAVANGTPRPLRADRGRPAATRGQERLAGRRRLGSALPRRLAHEQGNLAEADRHFGTVIADADRVHFNCLREAFFVQILAYEARGLRAEAGRAVARLRELAIASETPHQLELVDSFLARTALIRGDLPAAQRWLEAAAASLAHDDLTDHELPQLTRIKVLVAMRGDTPIAAAERLLSEFIAYARSRHMALALLEGLAVQALLHEARGDHAAASFVLRESLELAAPEGIVQRYAYLGPALVPVLHRLPTNRASPSHARAVLGALEEVLDAQGMAERVEISSDHEPLPNSLTHRELEVVRLLALRLTNNEIGENLFISAITVKHHVANIAGKFGVSGRRAAVDHARALGLVT